MQPSRLDPLRFSHLVFVVRSAFCSAPNSSQLPMSFDAGLAANLFPPTSTVFLAETLIARSWYYQKLRHVVRSGQELGHADDLHHLAQREPCLHPVTRLSGAGGRLL